MIEKEKIDSHIDSLIGMGFTIKEIKESIAKNTDLTEEGLLIKIKELNQRLLPRYDRVVKRYLNIALILGIITLISIILYKYFDFKYNRHLQSLIGTRNAISLGDGTYLIQGHPKWHEIFASIAGWTGVAGVASLIFSGITWIKKIRIKIFTGN